jgi:hypothetical protein
MEGPLFQNGQDNKERYKPNLGEWERNVWVLNQQFEQVRMKKFAPNPKKF